MNLIHVSRLSFALACRWLAEGMVYPHTVVPGGLDAAPQALVDLCDGAFTGSVVVDLAG